MSSPRCNAFGQPVGPDLPGWTSPPAPPRSALEGRLCRLEPLDPQRHGDDLYGAQADDRDGRDWTYMGYGPFPDRAAYRSWMDATCMGSDPHFVAIVDRRDGRAVGVASWLRITPAAGSIEVGHIQYARRLQRSAIATEAMYLMMRQVFALGYRRYEWKCDALNAPSRRAAQRLGFSYEGVFRQALVYKGRSRDTAWYAMIDGEWPAFRRAYEAWLDPANFDADGRQRTSLSDLTGPLLHARG